jgi:glucose-6-phosphate 1-dehydrogenase
VAAGSTVETYAALRLEVDSWRWAGVPWLLRAGKSLPITATEVVVRFKRPPLTHISHMDANYLRFRLNPEIAIGLGARVKRLGLSNQTDPVELTLVEHTQGDEVDAYERLLTDAMAGERLLFVREDAVDAAWAIVDQVLDNATPVHPYAPGTWGPPEADRLVAGLGGWHNPI